MVFNTILEAVGNPPMVRLSRMPEEGSAEILVKVEALNVGGSIKTRTALNMIEQAEKEGLISPDTIIVDLPAATRESASHWSERSKATEQSSSCRILSVRNAGS